MDNSVKQKLDDFFKQYKNQKFKKGEIIIRADDDPLGIYYLTEGVVRRYSISPSGEELTINIFRPISFFPMSWAINSTPTSHYFEAMTDVEVWRASKDDVNNFVKQNNDVMYDLLSRVYRGLEGYTLRMEYLMAGNARARLIAEILIYAKRFGNLEGNKIVVNLKLTEKDFTSQSGLTRETISRELQKLEKMKLVTFKKNQLAVLDLNQLEQLLTGA